MPAPEPILLHATAVALSGRAALIIGPSGTGKSDLALRAITVPVQQAGEAIVATLLADDQVELTREGHRLIARPPATIAGMLEVRGVGILPFPHIAAAEVSLIATVDPGERSARLPDPIPRKALLGLEIPVITLDPREPTAHIKLLLALKYFGRETP